MHTQIQHHRAPYLTVSLLQRTDLSPPFPGLLPFRAEP